MESPLSELLFPGKGLGYNILLLVVICLFAVSVSYEDVFGSDTKILGKQWRKWLIN